MSNEQESPSSPAEEPSLAECIEAGLYYFAREEYENARRWWEHALYVDPANTRAAECLRILDRAERKSEVAPPADEDGDEDDPFAGMDEADGFDPFAYSGEAEILPEVASQPLTPEDLTPDLPAADPPSDQVAARGALGDAAATGLESPASEHVTARAQAVNPLAPNPALDLEPSLLDMWSRPSLGLSPATKARVPSFHPGDTGFDPGAQLAIDGGIATRPPPPRVSRPPQPRDLERTPWPGGHPGEAPSDEGPILGDEMAKYTSVQVTARPLASSPADPGLRFGVEAVRGGEAASLFDGWTGPELFDVPAREPEPPAPILFEARTQRRDSLDEAPTPEELIGETPIPRRSSQGTKAPVKPTSSADLAQPERDAIRKAVEAFSLEAFDVSGEEPELVPIEAPVESLLTTPWDFGPAETTAVTLEEAADDDAVASKTPVPIRDRAPLFEAGVPLLAPAAAAETFPDVPARSGDQVRRRESKPTTSPGESRSSGPAPGPDPAKILRHAADRFALHDFDGALDLLESIPQSAPEHATALQMLSESRQQLEQMYSSKIGPLEAAPRVLLPPEELIWLNLNHRAGFLLSQVDGTVTYEDLVSVSGMPRLDTLRIICSLLQEGVIGAE